MTPPTPEQVAALEQWARDGKRIAGDPHAMVLALCETVREMQAEEREARTVLWLRHGHTGQYGDDGEMQCGACVPFYDYKRRRLSDVASTALLASQNTRDAAVARAEQAEWERDALERHRDELHERWSSEQARAAILQVAVGERTAERDAARAEVARLTAEREGLEGSLVEAVQGLKDCHMLARRALAAATRDGMAKHLPHIIRICERQAPEGTVLSSVLRDADAAASDTLPPLPSGPRRMAAYYYSFEPTGVACIDKILGAVACAGKAYHHTQDWADEDNRPHSGLYDDHTGDLPVEWIQNAANEAAAILRHAQQAHERMQEVSRG